MQRLTTEELHNIRLTESVAASSESRFPLIAILENIRSLYNVGSMFRTSDAARIEALFTVGYTPHPPRVEIEKTALGATRTVPHMHFDDTLSAIAAATTRGFHAAALEQAHTSRSIFTLDKKDFPMALVIGNEVTGVSEEALDAVHASFEIPMIGAKHSLNVAVAYGVAITNAMRVFADELEHFRPK